MTREQILAMKAGRELDAELAVKLFGWRWFHDYDREMIGLWPPDCEEWTRWNWHPQLVDVTESHWRFRRFSDWDRMGSPADRPLGAISFLPHFSTTWEGMRLIVEAIGKKGWIMRLVTGKNATVKFEREDGSNWTEWAISPLAPHAVALAAMLAVGGGDG